jgi:putative hemolysin
MNGVGTQLALIGLLILLNAAFAGTEIALISLRQSRIQQLQERSKSGRALAHLSHDPNRFLATIQIGITLAGFLASATAAVALAEPLVELLDWLGNAAEATAIVLVTLLLTFVTLVLGELVPKRLAMLNPERWALIAARPLALIASFARPVVWLLSVTTNLFVRVLGGDPSRTEQDITEEELRDLIASHRLFSSRHRTIIEGAFDIANRALRQILVPRKEVVVLQAEWGVDEGLQKMIDSGHSRAPVVEQDLDSTIGLVHIRDLVWKEGKVRDHAEQVLSLPETLDVLGAMTRMQQERQQLVVIFNEYGAAEGIVTIEDLVEELVGEIYDETDTDIMSVTRLQDGSFIVPGSFPIHDLTDIGVDLPTEGEYTTVAGLVLEHLARVPESAGDTIEVRNWRLTVLEVQDVAITRVKISAAA